MFLLNSRMRHPSGALRIRPAGGGELSVIRGGCPTLCFQLLRGTMAGEESKLVYIHIWMYNTP
jgi:hypothetical protein